MLLNKNLGKNLMNTMKRLITPKNIAILFLILFAIVFPELFAVSVAIFAIFVLLGVVFTLFFILADCVERNSWKPLKDSLLKLINK